MIDALARAWRLGARERALAARAWVWLAAADLLLRTMPFGAARRVLARASTPRPGATITPDECARAVMRAGRLLPPSTCLSRALAGACLLERGGRAATVAIGVAPGAPFRAHAWLECDGRILVGGGTDVHAPLVRERFALAARL
jgi:hypothetical protein